MAGGNRTVILRLPEELIWLIERYQNDRYLASRQAAVIELLETHPRIDETVRALYNEAKGEEHNSGG